MHALGNRAIAFLLCLLMIVGASLFGAAASLGSLREQSERSFTTSGMQQDLIDLSASCANVATVAGRHLSADDPDLIRVAELRSNLMSASTAGEKHDLAAELMMSTEMLFNRLQRLLGEETRAYSDLADDVDMAASAWAGAQSKQALLARGSYNESAAFYNLMLGKFPANVLGKLTGLKPLELYA